MAKDRFFDFDSYMDERKSTETPYIVKAFGEEHEIPATLPFDVVLEITRAKKDGEEEVSTDQLLEMCNTIFGEATFMKWRKNGITIQGITILTEKVIQSYMESAAGTSERMADNKRESLPNP